MRAGKLDRIITIQSVTNTVDANRVPVETWTHFATARAELVQGSTAEFLRGYGETEAMTMVFRTRWIDGVTVRHRVLYEDRALNIREIVEIGRKRGLELRCEEVRT